jgi:hypothetical protein
MMARKQLENKKGGSEMNSSTDHLFLVRRLEKLERQNRRFRIGALLVLLMVGSLVVIGARPANVIQAEKFVLVDQSGRTLATLGPDANGLPGLSIKDISTGKERGWLGLWGRGKEVGLGLYDQNEKERSRLGILADGTTRLSISDDSGNLRAWLGQSGNGKESGVGFYDGNEKERAWIGIAGGTTPRVIFYDAAHKESWGAP